MGLCSKRFGYQSPAVGAWTLALSLQMALGVLLVLIGHNAEDVKSYLEGTSLWTTNYVALQYVGIAHIVLSIVVGAIVALGLFVSSCFLLPLCIISIVQSILLVATSAICGFLLHPYVKEKRITVFHEEGSFPEAKDVFLATIFGGYLLTAAGLSLAALAVYGRAGSMKNDTPIPEAQLYLPCAGLLVASATVAAIGGGGEKPTVWMATILFALAVALAILVNIANCCCTPKFFNIVVGAGFACIALFCVVVCSIASGIYKDALSSLDYETYTIGLLPVDLPEDISANLKVFLMMGDGRWLLAFCCMTLATSCLALFSALYALRSVLFCCGKGDSS